MRSLIILSFLLLFSGYKIFCERFYVSPEGDNEWPGTIEQPWETIGKATSTIMAGDTVFIRGGTYYEGASFKNSGTAEEKIVLMAYENENVVMDGSSKYDTLIYIPGNYIEIHNIKLRNGRSWGILLESAGNIKIQNCDIQNIVHSGIRTLCSSNIEIVDNTINKAAEVTIWASGIRSSYDSNLRITGNNVTHIPSAGGISVDHSEYVIVEDNYTYNTVGPGIGIFESNEVEVNDNEVVLACNDGAGECLSLKRCHDFLVYNNEVHTSGIVDWGAEGICTGAGSYNGKIYNNYVHDLDKTAIYVCTSDTNNYNVEVFDNIVDNCQIGIAVGAEKGETVGNISIYRNIVTRSFGHGINVSPWKMEGYEEGLKKNIYIYNNTIYKNGTNEYYYRGGICVESSNVENIHILNNICSQNGEFQIGIMDNEVADEVFIEYNLIDGTQSHETAVYGDNYIEDSPEFVDAANFDFHLTENSPAIDSGKPDIEYFDPDCTPNDIGAYYYDQHPGISPPLNPIDDYIFPEDVDYQLIAADIRTVFPAPDSGRFFSFSVESDISKIMYSINDYELYLRPVHNFYGNCNIILTARDSCIYQSSDTFAVEILPVNDTPIIYNLPCSITFSVNSSYELIMKNFVADYDTPDSLLVWTFQLSNDLLTYQYNPETSILLLTSNEFDGEVNLVCTVTDDSLASAVESITIKITEPLVENINYKNQEHVFQLHNYPNPFIESTNFRFTLNEPGEVQIKIYDIFGREVETLHNRYCEAGENEIIWHPNNLLQGIYICSIQILYIRPNTTLHYIEQKKIIYR